MRTVLIILAAAALSILGTLLFIGKDNDSTSQETAYERVVRTGILRCGYAQSPPVLIKDINTGELKGLNVDLMNELGKELGLKIEWAEETGWGTFIEGLNANRYDMFCSVLWPDPGRTKNMTLIGPVYYSFLDAFARADDTRFDGNLARMNESDITLPVIDGDISASMAKNSFPNARRLSLPQMATAADMMESILTKKADVFFFDAAMANSIPPDKRHLFRKVQDVPSAFVFGAYFGVKSGEWQLRDMIEVMLDRMIDDGRLAAMTTRYSKDYAVPAPYYDRGER